MPQKKKMLLLWVWQKLLDLEPSVTYFLCSLSSAYSSFSVRRLYSVSCTWAHRKVVRITQNIPQHPDMIHFPSAVRTRRRCCRKSEANPCLVWLPYSPSHCLMLCLKVLCDVHLQKLEIQLLTRKGSVGGTVHNDLNIKPLQENTFFNKMAVVTTVVSWYKVSCSKPYSKLAAKNLQFRLIKKVFFFC